MTEYITKEQAEKIARKCGLASDDETIYGRIQMMAIELAFEQRLEVVGYKNRFSGTIVTNIPSWAVESESTPLYTLKSSQPTVTPVEPSND